MIDVLVVEDSRVIRDYLVYVLETDPEHPGHRPPPTAGRRRSSSWRGTGPT